MRADYLIYKRTLKNGKSYNVKFWNQETQCYDKRYSIGSLKNQLGDKALNISTTSKAGANAIVRIWLKEGKPQKSGEIISEYLSKFWKEDSDYVKSKKIRGRSLSSDYLHNSFICIEKHVIPFLRNCGKEGIYLSQVTPGLLEKLLTSLSENNNLSSRRINAIYQAVTVPLAEAERLGIISNNPAKRVQKLTEKKPERKILTPGEVKAFFGIVPEDLRLYGINMLAATTGMRLGECRGLKRQCLHDTWIEIKYNWQDSEGLKSPKWGSERIVPVPTKTMEILDDLSKKNPWGNGFIFYGSSRERPLGKRPVENYYRETLEKIEISNEERRERNLSFHAWRHFYNTMLRGHIPDYALRKLTGHHSAEMSDRYSAITEEQRAAVAELSEKIF